MAGTWAKSKNGEKSVIRDKERANVCDYHLQTRSFLGGGLCFCLSGALVVTFICMKATEIDSQRFLHRLISLKFKWLYVTLWWSSVPLIISEQCILFILYSGSLSIVHSNNWVWQHKRIGAMRPGHWANAAYTCLLIRLRPRLMCLRLEQRWHPDLQWPPSVTTPQHICISVHHESV